MFGISKKQPAIGRFWQWLATNTARVQSADGTNFGVIAQEIGKVFAAEYPGLTWEITRAKSGPWLFCVSAEGNKALFPRVRQEVSAAPALPGWTIQAFRPRGSLNAAIEMNGRKLTYDDIWCSVEAKGGGAAVTLWIRGLDEQNDSALGGAALVLLDNAVGEYDAVIKISQLNRGALPSEPKETATFFPLALLPAYLDSAIELI